MVRDDQPDAREGQAGRPGESERFAVPLKPGNSGGGKGPQFKTNATRSEGPGDWATYQLRRVFRNCRRRCTRKRRQKPGIASTPLYDKISREDILVHAYAQCRSNKGAPGVDGQDFADIEAYGVQRWLGELDSPWGADDHINMLVPIIDGTKGRQDRCSCRAGGQPPGLLPAPDGFSN